MFAIFAADADNGMAAGRDGSGRRGGEINRGGGLGGVWVGEGWVDSLWLSSDSPRQHLERNSTG